MKQIKGINCLSGLPERIEIKQGKIESIRKSDKPVETLSYLGPGLIDMQVNGINGIDFNDIALTPQDVEAATHYLLSKGVTTFFPTIITNSDQNVAQLLKTIRLACEASHLVNDCIGGIHLEGPFISKTDGARGAHDLQYIKAPDWQWVQTCQQVSGGRIKLVTFSPEWEDAAGFIRQCRKQGILVAIGHSYATPEQIRTAVQAGATLSTHLGNAVPLMLPRHPNLLWEQLAQDELYASIIADGFHLPPALIKVVIKAKGTKTILVSDATCFSGMPPGVYQTHIGDEVVLEKGGRLSIKKSPELLAGATKSLLENIDHLVAQKLVSLCDAWKMASVNPARFLGVTSESITTGNLADLVVFNRKEQKTSINQVIKKGAIVYEKELLANSICDSKGTETT